MADTIDPETRTVGVIVAVDRPYGQAVPGVRPPLTKNMFVEVEITGRPKPDRLIVPRSALHNGRLYLVGDDDRLVIRPTTVAFVQAGFAVIAEGLADGERVVISDIVPAIEGMRLAPVADEAVAAALTAAASGAETIR